MTAPRAPRLIGWREWVKLPDLGLPAFVAKIDTGARSSALHAEKIRLFQRDGAEWAAFLTVIRGRKRLACEARLVDERHVKNTSGQPELRAVIETRMAMGGRRWTIEATLADRKAMACALIVGRTAIRRRGILVDAGRSFLLGPPQEKSPSRTA